MKHGTLVMFRLTLLRSQPSRVRCQVKRYRVQQLEASLFIALVRHKSDLEPAQTSAAATTTSATTTAAATTTSSSTKSSIEMPRVVEY